MIPLLLSLLLSLPAASAQDTGAERITSMHVDIRHQHSGRTRIREEIAYDFGSAEKHGITRFIPLGNYPHRLGFTLGDVTADGTKAVYQEAMKDRVQNLRIGDANHTITGAHTYVISYVLENNVVFKNDGESFAWNAIGTNWAVPIEKASADLVVEKPDGSPIDPKTLDVHAACYTGSQGETGSDCTHTAAAESVHFETTRTLAAGEGMTVQTQLSAGTTIPPSFAVTLRNNVIASGRLLLHILALL